MGLLAVIFCAVIQAANIGNGIVLHYVEQGQGTPVVFVHGSISDGGYWAGQVPEFAKHYRTIAYSRRYNYPNTNPARPGYSAITDADDLARLVKTLHLGKIVVVGHSYGAFDALFFALRYPSLTRALVLAEPPAISLLPKSTQDDIRRRMVAPMHRDFSAGRREAGVADFIDYVFNDPHAWDKMDAASHADTMRDAHEWDVMMTNGTLFPPITPKQVRTIHVPVLLMTGDKTYPFLTVITRRLAGLLPNNQVVVIHGAGHQMWYQQPELCRDVTETFLRWAVRHGLTSP